MSCSAHDEKVMVNWAKSVLHEVDEPIKDISDFSDGINLARLVECLIGIKAFPQIRRREKSSFIHNVENINIVLQALAKNGLKLYGIDPYEIAKGKVKTLVILLWNLGRRYGVHNQIDEMKTLFGGIKWTKPEWASDISWDNCDRLSSCASGTPQGIAVSNEKTDGKLGETPRAKASESAATKPKEDDKEKQYVREMIDWINTLVEQDNCVFDIKSARNWKVVANVITVLTKRRECADYQTWTGTEEECMSRVLHVAEAKMHVPKLFEASEAKSINDVSWLLYYGSFVRFAVRELQNQMSKATQGFAKVDDSPPVQEKASVALAPSTQAHEAPNEGLAQVVEQPGCNQLKTQVHQAKAETTAVETQRSTEEKKHVSALCAPRSSAREATDLAKRTSAEEPKRLENERKPNATNTVETETETVSTVQEKRKSEVVITDKNEGRLSATNTEKRRGSCEKKKAQKSEQHVGFHVQGWGLQARGVRATENARFEITVPAGKQDKVQVQISGSKGQVLKQTCKNADTLTRVEPNTFALSAATVDTNAGTAVLQCMYNVVEPDDYEVFIKCDGKLLPKCPLKVNVVQWRESFVRVYGDGLTAAIVNKPACFLLEMNGEFGLVEVAIDGPKMIDISVNKLSGETYAVRYLPDERGEYLVHIKHNEKEIENSPHALNIIDTVPDDFDLSSVKLIDFDVSEVTVNCLHSFTVQVKRTSNVYPLAVRIWACGVAFQSCDVSVLVESIENRQSGVNFDMYLCTWKPMRYGQHVLTVSYNRILVFDAPKLIIVRQ